MLSFSELVGPLPPPPNPLRHFFSVKLQDMQATFYMNQREREREKQGRYKVSMHILIICLFKIMSTCEVMMEMIEKIWSYQ